MGILKRKVERIVKNRNIIINSMILAIYSTAISVYFTRPIGKTAKRWEDLLRISESEKRPTSL